jgi:hypothetical protein
MKIINPVSVRYNGQEVDAIYILCNSVNDNLSTQTEFGWTMFDASMNAILSGRVTMKGDDYLSWDGSNDSAYTWVAAQPSVNVTIVGTYTTTSTTTTTTTLNYDPPQ